MGRDDAMNSGGDPVLQSVFDYPSDQAIKDAQNQQRYLLLPSTDPAPNPAEANFGPNPARIASPSGQVLIYEAAR